MQAVTSAALPIFALILVGFLSGRFGLLDRAATGAVNRFAVYLALPALVFLAMAKIAPSDLRQYGFAEAFVGGIAIAFGFGFLNARWRGKGTADASIHGLDASYSNVGFMGIPLCLLLFGEQGPPPAIVATLFTACALFLFAIALIEIARRGPDARRGSRRQVAFALLGNPLMISPLVGLAVGASGLTIPQPIERFVSLLAGAASPCALVCIGLYLAHEKVTSEDMGAVAALVALKLLVQPAATALLAFHVFDVPPLWARAALLLAALPIGSGPFMIANLYGLETGPTSGAILTSHIVSVATVSLLVAWIG